MKNALIISFTFIGSLLSAENISCPLSADGDLSIATDPLGNRVAVWEEKGRILASEISAHGSWSMPVALSNPMTTASSPKLEIDSSGEATAIWIEDDGVKAASRPQGGHWIRSSLTTALLKSGKTSSPSHIAIGLNPSKKFPIFESSSLDLAANAIDAPTSSVLSGAQIGFAAGTAAPSNGLVCSGIAGFGTSSVLNDTALPAQINATASTERYFGANKAGTYGILFGYSNGSFVVTGGIIRTVTSDPFYIYVNNVTQAMQITSTALVGLSCTPVNRLDVSGAVAIGTYAGVNTAPSNGLIVSGQTLFKATSSFINAAVEVGGVDRIGLAVGGTRTATDGSVQAAQYMQPTFSPTSNTLIDSCYQAFPQFNPPVGITITRANSIYLQTGSQGGSGTVTTGYSLYVEDPGFGTTRYAAYFGGKVGIGTAAPLNNLDVTTGAAFGAYAGVNTAPSNAIIVSGGVAVGTTTLGNAMAVIAPTTANLYGLVVGGSTQGTAALDSAYGIVLNTTLNGPTSGTREALEMYVNPLFTAGAGTTSTMYGILIDSGTSTTNPGAGYGLKVNQPSYGATTVRFAAWINGGLVYKYTGQGANYTATVGDYYVGVTSTAAPRTITLPATVPQAGWTVIIKDESGGAATNNITVNGGGGGPNNIDAAGTATINTNYGSLRIYSNGTQYYTF